MELLLYWRILKRRWWIPVALVLLVAVSYLALTPKPAPVYNAGMRFVVGVRPEAGKSDDYTYDRYYTWLTAEYLLDDLAEVVKSQAFAEDVAHHAGIVVHPGAIQGATSAGKLHRILSVSVTWNNTKELAAISQAVVTVLDQNAGIYLGHLGTENAVVTLIDPPTVAQVPQSLQQRLDLPLRLILACIAGIALSFLIHYLDPTIRTPHELETMGLAVLGQIPSQPSLWQRLWRHRF